MSETTWRCQHQRSHGTCNAFNDAEDTSCGACGEDRPAPVPPAPGLSDERLAERVREIVSEMCKGDRWRMCVPAQLDDSDVAIIELLDRYTRTRSDAALGLRAAIERAYHAGFIDGAGGTPSGHGSDFGQGGYDRLVAHADAYAARYADSRTRT